MMYERGGHRAAPLFAYARNGAPRAPRRAEGRRRRAHRWCLCRACATTGDVADSGRNRCWTGIRTGPADHQAHHSPRSTDEPVSTEETLPTEEGALITTHTTRDVLAKQLIQANQTSHRPRAPGAGQVAD